MKKFGFGSMRLPCNSDDPKDIDLPQIFEMVDRYIESGFNYFDTAYGYHDGLSEVALRKAVTERYPREDVIIADKLPVYMLKPSHNLEEIFSEQKERCGVEYFDYYMLHNITNNFYNGIIPQLKCFEFAEKLKEEGFIRHLGISFHDDAETLDKILSEHPSIEFVQLQINYLDWESDSVQSRKCYEVCQKYHKPVIVMEPVKGGKLVNIPQAGIDLLKAQDEKMSVASWAIRFASSLDDVFMVLSGMSTWEQLEDNLSYMEDFKPLTKEGIETTFKVAKIINDTTAIACTACNYCKENCPMQIQIPEVFELYNNEKRFGMASGSKKKYQDMIKTHAKASDCIECRSCEGHCPQHLTIVDYLKIVAKTFED